MKFKMAKILYNSFRCDIIIDYYLLLDEPEWKNVEMFIINLRAKFPAPHFRITLAYLGWAM